MSKKISGIVAEIAQYGNQQKEISPNLIQKNRQFGNSDVQGVDKKNAVMP